MRPRLLAPLVAVLLSPAAGSAQAAMFRGGPAHLGSYASPPATLGGVAWRFRTEGRVLSSVLSFIHRGTIMPYYSGATPDADRHSANNFMYFKLMEWASKRGLGQQLTLRATRPSRNASRVARTLGTSSSPANWTTAPVSSKPAPKMPRGR